MFFNETKEETYHWLIMKSINHFEVQSTPNGDVGYIPLK
jgi:hypothetical protein